MKTMMLPFLVGAVLVLSAACGDDTNPPQYDTGADMSADMGVDVFIDDFVTAEAGTDMGVDTSAETGVDTGVDTGADMAGDITTTDGPITDAPSTDAPITDAPITDAPTTDAPITDGPTTDAPAATKPWVLYSVNTSANKYTFNQVNIDGTGQQVVSGIAANIELCELNLNGNVLWQDINRTKPVQASEAGEDVILLPGGLGKLSHWYDGTDYGLAVLGADGTINLPLAKEARSATTSGCGSAYYVAVSDDGKLAAVVLEETKVALVKLDGTTWSGSSPASHVLDITPTGTTNIQSIIDDSLTIGASTLLFVVDETTGDDALYAAPLDGSAKAAKVTLPNVESKAPVYVNWRIGTSPSGDHFAIVAGASATKEAVIVYKDGATPTMTVVSNTVTNYSYSGNYFMDSFEPKIAFSATGKYIAFTTTATDMKPYVASTDGVNIWDLSNQFNQTGATATVVDEFGAFYWIDDENLLLWAGTDDAKDENGLYHFKVSTKALTNLAGSTKTAAPWDGGNLLLDGGWVDPSGKFLYFLAGPLDSGSTSNYLMDLWSVDLTAITAAKVTSGLDISSGAYIDTVFEPVPGTNLVAFVAKLATNNATPYFEDLYVFDQSTGAASSLKKLTSTPTSGTSSSYINNIMPSPDGAQIGYTTGSGSNTLLAVVPVAGGTSTVLNGTTGSYVEDAYAWTPDSTSVAYGGGTSTSALDLRLIPAAGGTHTTLHASQSYLFVFGVYK